MKPIPDGYATVTPWLISHDTPRLIDYVAEAFGAVELGRVTDADGRVEHAEIRIGDSVVMLFDAAPGWPPTPGFLRLYVEDADETHRRAVAAGGTSVTEVTHLFFGDRVGRVAADGTRDFVTAPYRFEVLPGVGHFVAEQAPERVNELLLAHVRANSE